MTPSNDRVAAAPLMGAAGVRNLFYTAIDEEGPQPGEQQHEDSPTAASMQLATSGRLPTSSVYVFLQSGPQWAVPDGC
jgi:hypothetical protein